MCALLEICDFSVRGHFSGIRITSMISTSVIKLCRRIEKNDQTQRQMANSDISKWAMDKNDDALRIEMIISVLPSSKNTRKT